MVFEPNFAKVISSARKNIGITQVVVEAKLPIVEGGVQDVYSVGANSAIFSYDFLKDDIEFSGVVDFQVLYNGDMGVSALDYSVEFKNKMPASRETIGELIVNSSIVDLNTQVFNGGVKVVAVLEIVIDEIASKDLNVLINVNGEKVCQNFKTINFSTYLGKAYEKFDVTHDLVINGATNILMVTPCVKLEKVMPRDNYVVLTGVLGLDVCYKNGEGLNSINNEYFDVDFSWEVALDGINDKSVVQSNIFAAVNEIKISSTPSEDGMQVNLYIPMVYSGYVFNSQELQVVDDVYLEDYYLSVTVDGFESFDKGSSLSFVDNISGTASILDTAPFIDEIIGVATNNIVLAKSEVFDNHLVVEGVANVNVLYFTKDTGDITSVQVEMPFITEQKVAYDNSSVVSICMCKVNARSKRGKEIEVSAELGVYCDLYSLENLDIISNVTVASPKPEEDCSLVMYVVKPNQTLWDIAKELGVSQDKILEQNSNIEMPLKAGDKIVIYNPKIVKF